MSNNFMIFEFTNNPKASNKWSATYKSHKDGTDQIELRKTINGTSVLIIVGSDGWYYGQKGAKEFPFKGGNRTVWSHIDSTGLNVRFSLNGPLRMDWDGMKEFEFVINEAKELLEMDKKEREALIALKYK